MKRLSGCQESLLRYAENAASRNQGTFGQLARARRVLPTGRRC